MILIRWGWRANRCMCDDCRKLCRSGFKTLVSYFSSKLLVLAFPSKEWVQNPGELLFIKDKIISFPISCVVIVFGSKSQWIIFKTFIFAMCLALCDWRGSSTAFKLSLLPNGGWSWGRCKWLAETCNIRLQLDTARPPQHLCLRINQRPSDALFCKSTGDEQIALSYIWHISGVTHF